MEEVDIMNYEVLSFLGVDELLKKKNKDFQAKKKISDILENFWKWQSESLGNNLSIYDIQEKLDVIQKRNNQSILEVIVCGNDAEQRERMFNSIKQELETAFPEDKDNVLKIWNDFIFIIKNFFEDNNIELEGRVLATRIEDNLGAKIEKSTDKIQKNSEITNEKLDKIGKDVEELKAAIGYGTSSECNYDGAGKDLKNSDFQYRSLCNSDFSSANLSHANFSESILVHANFNNSNLSNADLSDTELREAIFTKAILSGAWLCRAICLDANFSNSNMSDAALCDAVFAHANLSGANLRGANLRGANLSHANLSVIDIGEIGYEQTILCAADLSEAILSGADLRGADLSEAILSGADLSGADLGVFIRETENIMTRMKDFINVDLVPDNIKTNLSGADLSDTDLSGADLTGADLSGADLSDADLRGADLTFADLSGADLTGAILIGATLIDVIYSDYTDFTGAKYCLDEHYQTVFSDDFNPEEHGMIKVD